MASEAPRITGLDLSLTSSGMVTVCGSTIGLLRVQPDDGPTDHARIDYIRRHVWDVAVNWPADLVVIEQTAYAQTTGKAHERAGLWWICTRMLWRAKVPYAVVTPQQLKKYATGYGAGKNSGKDKVLAAVIKRYPMADADGNDVADALVLAAMGADHLGCPLAPVPANHRAALAGVRWPLVPAQN